MIIRVTENFHCFNRQVKETAENVDEAVRELPDANKVTFEVLDINGAYDLISDLLHMMH